MENIGHFMLAQLVTQSIEAMMTTNRVRRKRSMGEVREEAGKSFSLLFLLIFLPRGARNGTAVRPTGGTKRKKKEGARG
jgi:hypothetical protein